MFFCNREMERVEFAVTLRTQDQTTFEGRTSWRYKLGCEFEQIQCVIPPQNVRVAGQLCMKKATRYPIHRTRCNDVQYLFCCFGLCPNSFL